MIDLSPQSELNTDSNIKKPQRAFLAGAKWQNVGIADEEESNNTLHSLRSGNLVSAVSTERCINACAISLIRYSSSEWSNDYFAKLEDLAFLNEQISKSMKG